MRRGSRRLEPWASPSRRDVPVEPFATAVPESRLTPRTYDAAESMSEQWLKRRLSTGSDGPARRRSPQKGVLATPDDIGVLRFRLMLSAQIQHRPENNARRNS